MLSRLSFPVGLSELTLVDVEQLRTWWASEANDGFRGLHRCLPECGSDDELLHDRKCQYVQGIDAQAAVDAAAIYLREAMPAAGERTYVTAEMMNLDADAHTSQAELTLSLVADPVAVHSNGRYATGRHRVRTLPGAGVRGEVPVFVAPAAPLVAG